MGAETAALHIRIENAQLAPHCVELFSHAYEPFEHTPLMALASPTSRTFRTMSRIRYAVSLKSRLRVDI